MIKVRYSSIDRFSQSRSFKTLVAARRYAVKWVGENPDLGIGYAVSADGVGKVTVSGVSLGELFAQPEAPNASAFASHDWFPVVIAGGDYFTSCRRCRCSDEDAAYDNYRCPGPRSLTCAPVGGDSEEGPF